MSLADELFRGYDAFEGAQDKLAEALDAVDSSWVDFTFDYHDTSVELYFDGAPSNPDVVAAKMFSIGFDLCWIHPHKPPRDDCKCPARSRPKLG